VTRAAQGAGRPLLPPGGRSRALLAVLACVIIVASMGVWLAHGTHAGPLDARVDHWLDVHVTTGRWLVLRVKALGDPQWVTVVCAALVLACLALRRYRGALLVAIAVPLAGGITEFALKPLFDRRIYGFLSFPSGHVTAVSAMAATGMLLLLGPARPPVPAALRWLGSAVAVLVVLTVAVSMVIGNFHYFTDTIGGACVGPGTVLATALALDWLSERLTRRRAPAREPAASEPAAREPAARDGISAAARGLPPV
jgi:membrane-associated phospholipid phosphatase